MSLQCERTGIAYTIDTAYVAEVRDYLGESYHRFCIPMDSDFPAIMIQ